MPLPRLTIDPTGRRLQTADGKPFFWLADTGWTAATALHWLDVRYYFQKRLDQGFSVIQLVALDPEGDLEMRSPCGEAALHNGDPLRPNERYFEYLDKIIRLADEMGLYVMLLPAWGQLVVGDNWGGGTFPKTITEENAYGYARWLGNRYKNDTNLVWCLGGDRHPIHKGVDYKGVWRQMAEGLAKGLTGQDLAWSADEDAWKKLLITYHTCYDMQNEPAYSTTTQWGPEDKWISFIMLQSGHKDGVQNYRQVEKDYALAPPRPVFDGEPCYEDMPTQWPFDENTRLHGGDSVRPRAYWSLFAGAFGFTYGNGCVWCMVKSPDTSPWRPLTWRQALDQPAAWQMRGLRDLVDSRPFHRALPRQALIAAGQDNSGPRTHIQACIDSEGSYAMAYLPSGGSVSIDCAALGDTVDAWWWDPRTGMACGADGAPAAQPQRVDATNGPAGFTAPDTRDWVLVLDRPSAGYGAPGKPIVIPEDIVKAPTAQDMVFGAEV